MDVSAWLRGLGLEQYDRAFRDNDIGADLLPSLTEADLREIGVASLGHRKRLLAAIGGLVAAPAGESAGLIQASALERPAPPPASQAERRQLTVLFCDLVGSTALASWLDPEELTGVVASYHRSAATVVERWAGRVAGYMGDGVLAFFGHPRADEDDAERAVRAGLELVETVGTLAPPDLPPMQARVGIATGLVVVGRIFGGGEAPEQGAVGATPNLAARLQAAAEPSAVAVDAITRRLLGQLFEWRDLGAVDAKGFSCPVRAWRALRPSAVRSRFEALRAGAASAPLVGRDEEIGLLLRRWADARGGEGRVVLLSGEPGIGKSRIAAELMRRLGEVPHTRLRYFCSPHHRDSPLFPFIGQLERAAGFGRDDSADTKLGKLEALLSPAATGRADDVAFAADLLGLPTYRRHPLPDLGPQQRKERLLDALLTQLAGLAARRPILAVFEDAHWADPTSLELLGLAAERLRRLPAMLVVTSRPGFHPPWSGSPHATALALGGLGRREAASLAAQTAGGAALPAGAVERIVERAEGVPLFLEELTRAAVEAGWRQEDPGSPAAEGPSAGDVPAALLAPLTARLDRLGAAKEAAQVGAVIGHEFTYELLAAVASRPDAELRGALERLVEAGLVSRTGGEPPRASFLFKHALVRDAAYGTLLLARRRVLHAAVARALERLPSGATGARPELLARHFDQAGMAEEAIGRYAEAGRQAVARSANAEAATHLRRALDLLPALPDAPARWRRELELQAALAAALAAAEGYASPEAGRAHERARALCERLGDARGLVEVAGGQCSYHCMRAETRRAVEVAEDLLRTAERERSHEMLLAAHRLAGISLLQAGRLGEARRHLDTAADLLDRAGDNASRMAGGKDALFGVPVYRATALLLLGHYRQAKAQKAIGLAAAERLARPHRFAMALAISASWSVLAGEDAPRLLDDLESLVAEQGFRYWADYALMLRGSALARAGAIREGVALLRRGAAGHDAAGASWAVPHLMAAVAEAVGGGEGLALADEALARSAGTDVGLSAPELRRTRGALLAGQGDAAGAEADFVRALDLARQQGAKHWELRAAIGLARLWHEQGKSAEARELLAPVHGWFDGEAGTPDLKCGEAVLGVLL